MDHSCHGYGTSKVSPGSYFVSSLRKIWKAELFSRCVYFHKRPIGDRGEFSLPVPCPDEYQPLAETGGTAVRNRYIADQCMGQNVYVGQGLGH